MGTKQLAVRLAVGSLLASVLAANAATTAITVAPTTVTVTEGDSASYDITLSRAPTAPVVIALTTANGRAVPDTNPVVFTPTGGLTQTVVVTVPDTVRSGDDVIHHEAASADRAYDGIFIPDVTIDIVEAVPVNPDFVFNVESVEVDEGTQTTYTLKLSRQPTGVVSVALTPTASGVTVSPTSVTFGAGGTTWNGGATVTVTSADDNRANGALANSISHNASSTDRSYDGLSADLPVTVADNDDPEVRISPLAVIVNEDGPSNSHRANYGVYLTNQPAGTVTVTPSGFSSQVTVSPSSLTFDAANYNTAQNFTVQAVSDLVAEQAVQTTTISHSATGYSTVPSVAVTINDNDVPGFALAQSGGSTSVTEGGAVDSYTVQLNTTPSSPVTIKVTATAGVELAGAAGGPWGSQVTLAPFTVANTAQTVFVQATNDLVDDDAANSATLSHTVTSSDSNYDGKPLSNVTVSILDNDTAGLTLADNNGEPKEDGLFVSEDGRDDNIFLSLDTQPSANTVVTLNPGSQLKILQPVAVDGVHQLTFTPSNYAAKEIVVTAVDDADIEDLHDGVVTMSVADGGAAEYAGMSVTQQVTVLDNDTRPAALLLSPAQLALTEGGGTKGIVVKLNKRPIEPVNVVCHSQKGQVTVSGLPATAVQFDANYWGQDGQEEIRVGAIDDKRPEGTHSDVVQCRVETQDAEFSNVSDRIVTITITDSAPVLP